MLKQLRLVLLLYLLLFVAVGHYLTSARTTDWDAPLWVDVYPVNGDGSVRAEVFIDGLGTERFAAIETFLASEAKRYGVGLDHPFRLNLAPQLQRLPPRLPPEASLLGRLLWSLKLRWFGVTVRWNSERPAPDIMLFAIYHDDTRQRTLDRSLALEKGLLVVANLFAGPINGGPNDVVMAHEMLHTLGATDKYDPRSNIPRFPEGYANPGAKPLHPQRRAELMGARVPLAPARARIPDDLHEVSIGPQTALEIGWTTMVQ